MSWICDSDAAGGSTGSLQKGNLPESKSSRAPEGPGAAVVLSQHKVEVPALSKCLVGPISWSQGLEYHMIRTKIEESHANGRGPIRTRTSR